MKGVDLLPSYRLCHETQRGHECVLLMSRVVGNVDVLWYTDSGLVTLHPVKVRTGILRGTLEGGRRLLKLPETQPIRSVTVLGPRD